MQPAQTTGQAPKSQEAQTVPARNTGDDWRQFDFAEDCLVRRPVKAAEDS